MMAQKTRMATGHATPCHGLAFLQRNAAVQDPATASPGKPEERYLAKKGEGSKATAHAI